MSKKHIIFKLLSILKIELSIVKEIALDVF